MATRIGHGKGPDATMCPIGHDVGFVAVCWNRDVHLALGSVVLLLGLFDRPPSINVLLDRAFRVLPDIFGRLALLNLSFFGFGQPLLRGADKARAYQLAVGCVITRRGGLTLKGRKQIVDHTSLLQRLTKGPDRVPVRRFIPRLKTEKPHVTQPVGDQKLGAFARKGEASVALIALLKAERFAIASKIAKRYDKPFRRAALEAGF